MKHSSFGLRAIVAALALYPSAGCGSEPAPDPVPSEISAEDQAKLLVVTLPDVDFNHKATPLADDPNPADLGITLPLARFIVRFEGRRTQGVSSHHQAIINIKARGKNGELVVIAACRAIPVGDVSQETALYEGVCRKPSRAGPAFIEVNYRKKVLVGRVTVR